MEGDRALKAISLALTNTFREKDIIGRVGGDEFCLYLEGIPSVDFVKERHRAITEEISRLNPELEPKISIGAAILDTENNYSELFLMADSALYEAKSKGGNQVVIFNETSCKIGKNTIE